MNNLEQFQLLINILNDPKAYITEKDDAAMYLSKHDNDQVISALLEFGKRKEEDEVVLNSCGETLGEIWVKRDLFPFEEYSLLLPIVRHGIFYVIRSEKPEWVKKYHLDQDNFKD